MNNIFKPLTLAWWQTSILKLTLLAVGVLLATYWPVVSEWTVFWWVVFVLGAIYTMYLRFSNR